MESSIYQRARQEWDERPKGRIGHSDELASPAIVHDAQPLTITASSSTRIPGQIIPGRIDVSLFDPGRIQVDLFSPGCAPGFRCVSRNRKTLPHASTASVGL